MSYAFQEEEILLTNAGFSAEEINDQKRKKRKELENAGFSDEEIDKFFGERNDDINKRELSENTLGNLSSIATMNWSGILGSKIDDAITSAVGDDFEGYKHFVERGVGKGTLNLMAQQHFNLGLDYKKAYEYNNDTGWLEEYLEGMGTLIADLPIFIGASAATGGPITGAALGGLVNDTLKNAYYEALEAGDVDTFSEYMQLYMKAGLEHGIKGGVTLAGGIGAPALIRKIGQKTGAKILGRQLENVEKNRLSKYAAVYTGLLASGAVVHQELPTASDAFQLALITATFGFADKAISQVSRKANSESKPFQEMMDDAFKDPKKMEDLANRNSSHFEGDIKVKQAEVKEINREIKKLEKEIEKEGDAIPDYAKVKADRNQKKFDADTRILINAEKAAKIELLKNRQKTLETELKLDGETNTKRIELEKTKIEIEKLNEKMNVETLGQPLLIKYNKLLKELRKLEKERNQLKHRKSQGVGPETRVADIASKSFKKITAKIKKLKIELKDTQLELNKSPESFRLFKEQEAKLKKLEKTVKKLELELPETNLPLTAEQILKKSAKDSEFVKELDAAIEIAQGPKIPITEQFKEVASKWKDVVTSGSFLDAMTSKFLDRITPIKKFDAEFKAFVERFATNPESFIKEGALNIYERFRIQPGTIGRGLHFIEHGQLNFGLEIIGKSFKQIMKNINTPYVYEQFGMYAKAKRVLEKWEQGDKDAAAIFEGIGLKEPPITIARRIVENGNRVYGGKFIKTFLELREFQTNVLKYLKDSELISDADLKRILDANYDYVPFHRMLEIDIFKKDLSGKEQMALVANPMKRYIGSKQPIFDPIEAIYKNTIYQIVLAEKNVAYRQLVESLEFAQKIGKETFYGPKIEFKPELGQRSKEKIDVSIKELEKLQTEGSRAQREQAKDLLTRKKIELEIERYKGQNKKTALDKIAKIKKEIKTLKEQIEKDLADGAPKKVIKETENKIKDLEIEILQLEKQNTKVALSKIKELQDKLNILPKPQFLELKEFYEAQKKYGIPQDTFTIFRPNHQILGNGELLVYRNGKAQKWFLGEEIVEAASLIDKTSVNNFVRLFGTPTRLLRVGATLDPEFMLRNLSRDTLSATVFSRNDFIPIVDTIKGLTTLIKAKRGDAKAEQLVNEYVKSGAMQSVLLAQDKNYFKVNIKNTFGKRTFKEIMEEIKPNNLITNPVELQNVWTVMKGAKKLPGQGYEALRDLGAMFETGSRLRDFELTIKDKKYQNLSYREKLERAGFEARDVALDFARMGRDIASINAMSAFFNARLQGYYKTFSTFKNKETRLRAFKKAATFITLPQVLFWIGNHDYSWENGSLKVKMSQEYLDLPQWRKDLFFNLRVGFGEDKTMFSFPKPFELGLLFGTLPEHLLNWLSQKDPEMLINFMTDQSNIHLSGISPLPDLAKIYTAHKLNYDWFRKNKMISARHEGLNNYQQWNARTSEFAKVMGQFMWHLHGDAMWFSSPIRIDAMAQQIGGGLLVKLIQIIDKGIIAAAEGAREAIEEAEENGDNPDEATWFGINAESILNIADPQPQITWTDYWNDLSTAPLVRVFFAKNPLYSAQNQNIADFYKIVEKFEKVHKSFGYVKKMLGAGHEREWNTFMESEQYLTMGEQARQFMLRMRTLSLYWNSLAMAHLDKDMSYAERQQEAEGYIQDIIDTAREGVEEYKLFKEEIDEELKLLND
jgi:hypothetical protein